MDIGKAVARRGHRDRALRAVGGFASSALAEENEQFENERLAALNVGLQGYVYAQPLLDSQRIYSTITSVTKADTQGGRAGQPVLAP